VRVRVVEEEGRGVAARLESCVALAPIGRRTKHPPDLPPYNVDHILAISAYWRKPLYAIADLAPFPLLPSLYTDYTKVWNLPSGDIGGGMAVTSVPSTPCEVSFPKQLYVSHPLLPIPPLAPYFTPPIFPFALLISELD
jgi:hypothetical protein